MNIRDLISRASLGVLAANAIGLMIGISAWPVLLSSLGAAAGIGSYLFRSRNRAKIQEIKKIETQLANAIIEDVRKVVLEEIHQKSKPNLTQNNSIDRKLK